MIKIDFSVECPNCGETDKTAIISDGEVSGDHVEACSSCGKKYVISWTLFADSVVSELGTINPPVKCAATLGEYSIPEEDEDEWQYIEGEA